MADKAPAGDGTRFRLFDDGPIVTAGDEDITALSGGASPKASANVPTLDSVKGDAQQRSEQASKADQGKPAQITTTGKAAR